jgi:GNAT superfamily N-acetyltransferase
VVVDRIEVTRAAPDRLDVLAPVFGRAFAEEPMMLWPLGDQGDVVERYTRCFSYVLDLALARGDVLEAGDGNGAAIWFPPGEAHTTPGHPWTQPRIDTLAADAQLYDDFWNWVDDHTPEEPLWQLDSIGVRAQDRGRGVGSALIRAGIERARSDGVGAFVTTGSARNVPIYERCGFEVLEEADAPDGGPHIWFMRAGERAPGQSPTG